MNKKIKILLIVLGIIILIVGLIFGLKRYLNYLKIKNAVIEITYKNDLTVEFSAENIKVSNFIESINGEIINDFTINSLKLGKQDINYEYINDDGIKLKQSFVVEVVDKTPPLIWLNSAYSISVGSKDTIVESVLCGDNLDSNPKCYIEGEYDLNTVGKYPLVFKAEDKYGNLSTKNFTLNVYKPSSSSSSSSGKTRTYKKYSDIVAEYKNENTKIGLDLSEWQDYPDYDKLKEAGVEFVILRVGGTKGREGDYFLDKSFEHNIKEANRVGIPVGLYFFSYATSSQKAKENAEWLLKQIEGKKVDLPISFDWENWNKFNQYHISFYELSEMANTFIKTVESKGYKGMNYGSKTYLENMWLPSNNTIWLAHYTSKTSYKGKYKFWQLCDNALVDGINGPVDVNIMYNN